jgi:hypothetical protein
LGQAFAVFQAFSLRTKSPAKLRILRLLSQKLKFWESLPSFYILFIDIPDQPWFNKNTLNIGCLMIGWYYEKNRGGLYRRRPVGALVFFIKGNASGLPDNQPP